MFMCKYYYSSGARVLKSPIALRALGAEPARAWAEHRRIRIAQRPPNQFD